MSRFAAQIFLLLACIAAAPATQSWETRSIRPAGEPAAVSSGDGSSKTTGSDGLGLTRVALALGVVVGAILVLRWVGKRFFSLQSTSGSAGAVQVVSRTTIGPRQQLVLIQVGRRLVLTGNVGAQMNALCEIKDEAEVAEVLAKVRGKKEFDSALGAAGKSYTKSDETETVADAQDGDPAVEKTREEISGLMDTVRSMAKKFTS